MWRQLGRALALSALVAASCGRGEDTPQVDGAADHLARARAAAFFVEEQLSDARAAMAPLVERDQPDPEDLVRAAILMYEDEGERALDGAVALLRRAEAARPDWAVPPYCIGAYLKESYQLEPALESLQRAVALAPTDIPSRYHLAHVLRELDRTEEAADLYRELMAEDLQHVGEDWMASIIYKYSRLLIESGSDQFEAVNAQLEALRAQGFDTPQGTDLVRGNFGKLRFPDAVGTSVPAPGALALGQSTEVKLLGESEHVELWSMGGNWAAAELEGETVVRAAVLRPSEIVGWGSSGVRIASATEDGGRSSRHVIQEPVDLLRPIDWDDDGFLELAAVMGGKLVFYRAEDDSFTPAAIATPALPSAPRDLQAVDFDHDGDQDLLLVGEFGARVWRNDGLAAPELQEGGDVEVTDPRFADATAEARLPATPFGWCLIEDFDHDQDVDLLFGSSTTAYLADNLRGGVFADRSDYLNGMVSAVEPIAADVNGDEYTDLWIGGDALYLGGAGARMRKEGAASGASAAGYLALDVDLDGALDVVRGNELGLDGRQALGLPVEAALRVEQAAGSTIWTAGDLDGDRTLESLTVTGGALHIADITPAGNSIPFALVGDKDNRRGLGAIVEVLAGDAYRRIYWMGESMRLGIGDAARVDVIRVTWPNGVVQHVIDAKADEPVVLRQIERLAGSCPFLYTWNGETYTFISDVLGITPLGLPMAPGQLVPFDHDEYVLVSDEELVPREEADGSRVFDMQITEELREVTYLDQARLLVVDHPEGTELYPNERFTFPPFPERHEFVVRDPLSPKRAVDHKGADWAAELAAIDGDMAMPFEFYTGQFRGLAEPHFLELEFDAEALAHRADDPLRLLLTGWLFWTNASVNVAAARTGGTDFVPPILQVPDGDGGWVDAGPPVGFPAGKTKTMVLDVSEILRRDDPRIRVFCTLRLYWDSIRLAVGEDEPTRITTLEPLSADLWDRGFSKPVFYQCTDSTKDIETKLREQQLEWFDWDLVESDPPWNQHPGFYTKLGGVLPLLDAVDDRYVIMGAGDSLRVRFSADGLAPPEAGWTRDYLLFLDGWAKDRDPNTVEALEVEPLPFHGMTGYPYPAGESFPTDELHETWRREWNTRPAKVWIQPLSRP